MLRPLCPMKMGQDWVNVEQGDEEYYEAEEEYYEPEEIGGGGGGGGWRRVLES